MNAEETKGVLSDTRKVADIMDDRHILKLFNILTNAQEKKPCAFFLFIDMKKCVKQILTDLITSKDVNLKLSCRQMKSIYMILGDYGLYPVCKLCERPIKINSMTPLDSPGAFSWDHKIPRSFGGTYDLKNMQPTHKLCNNKRGCRPLPLHLSVEVNINCNCCDNQEYRQLKKAIQHNIVLQNVWLL